MAAKNQAPKPHRRIRRVILAALDDRYLSMTSVAKTVRHDLAVVSKAINYGRYPRVLKKVREALDV